MAKNRYIVKQVQKRPNNFAIWDKWEKDYVRFNKDKEAPYFTSPYPFQLTQLIKNRL